MLARIERAFTRLCEYPASGAERGVVAAGLRVSFELPYAIYYLARRRELIIMRLLHTKRDIETAFAKESRS
jgi:plasmid stabilization system protein ParE